ncbi:MAG: N-acetylglucosamine-6-phosphate deacetylase [Ancalomicrobiaceae bacterium]|nr:N-acetylglucosamine-6-phosphate deacetylase [Ancalomicrobiaceae bacterium]
MTTAYALTAERLFTGEDMLTRHALLIDDRTIVDVVPIDRVPTGVSLTDLGAGTLAPGFIDAQVNGGGGILFSGTTGVDELAAMARAHTRHGTTALLPTLITDTPDGMRTAIRSIREAIDADVPGIAGVHLEGPFLSVARKGAHDPALIRPMAEDDFTAITGAGIDTLLLTVAPETVPAETISRLAAAGIIVSLGHSDAPYELVVAAAAAGARGVTHLFNAQSQLQGRKPGVVGAALDTGSLWAGIIPDGIHVHPASLRLAIAAKRGPGKLFIVTDAMPTAGAPGDVFHLNGRRVTRQNGRLTLDNGTIAGSDLTMDQAVAFAVGHLGVDLAEALRMASLYPAEFLHLEGKRGRLKHGYRADIVHLGPDLSATATWIGGEPVR